MLEFAAPGAVFLLNSPYDKDHVWDHLPREVQEDIINAGDHIGVGPLSFLCQIDGQPANATSATATEQPEIEFEELAETAGEEVDEDALLADFGGLAEDDDVLDE